MPDNFITENFLLQNDRAVELYHGFARDLPIIDYHCHLPPRQIAEDHRFCNLTQIWLYGDHYKWRAMRTAGVAERYCTGDASDWEKFEKWAEVVPRTLRNPLYHWTHLDLKRPLGVSDRLLSPRTAQSIWDDCNARLAGEDMSCRGILRQMKVEVVCTTDDPTDSLEHHAAIAVRHTPFKTPRVPTFPARLARLAIDNVETFNRYIDRLAEVAGTDIGDSLPAAWKPCGNGTISSTAPAAGFLTTGWRRSRTWKARCRRRRAFSRGSAAASRRRRRRPPVPIGNAPRDGPLGPRARLDAAIPRRHMRNNNSRMFALVGPDAGFDSIGDASYARGLARFLDRLDRTNQLAKTILYNINPGQNDVLATMIGNFQDGSVPGKLQFGSGWWFLDQKDGMEKQLNCLSNLGLLSTFVGMLTDSRSFLSYTRHEYFRRILCNLLGTEMRQGLMPDDIDLVGGLVRDVCHDNAARYFGF